ETWRKRRVGLTPLADLTEINHIPLQSLLSDKADIELVNALTWRKSQGGDKLKQILKNMKLHCSVTLSKFSKMKVEINYLQSKHTIDEQQQTAMVLIVAFSGARMTELVLIKEKEMIQEPTFISFKTQTSKRNVVIDHAIKFYNRNSESYPVKALKQWLNDKRKQGLTNDPIWWNLRKNIQATPDFCSHQLTAIIKRASVPDQYSGSTIRHAMMTRLRDAGASQAEINAFTRHSLTSNVVDAYYYRPVDKDLASQFIINEKSQLRQQSAMDMPKTL
ncbi:MAG: hypothetical protein EZS28_047208, partial [Streblomastix strix]